MEAPRLDFHSLMGAPAEDLASLLNENADLLGFRRTRLDDAFAQREAP